MIQHTIIVENDESPWQDATGVHYHFPPRYKKFLEPGTQVVYYKGSLKNKAYRDKRLSSKPHYFGTATIGAIREAGDGNCFAEIRDYQLFSRPVLAKNDGQYLEHIPESRRTNYWRDGVRPITHAVYQAILGRLD